MKLEEIMELADKDAKIDYTEIGTESMTVTKLISKWLGIYALESVTFLKLKRQYEGEKKNKWEYYSGKGETPFELRLLKTDIPLYLDNDPDLTKVKDRMDLQEVKMKFIEGYVKALQQRGYNLKNALDYLKFTSGAG